MVYGSFYDFSPGNFFRSIDVSFVIWITLFILFFAIIYYATSKMFRNNKAIPAILGVLISILTIYFMSKTGSVENLIFNLQFIDIRRFLPWIFLIISAIIIWRFGIGMYIMVVSFTITAFLFLGTVGRNGFGLTTSIIMFFVGLKIHLVWKKRKKRKADLRELDPLNQEKLKRMWEEDRERDKKKWEDKGKDIGRWIGKKYYGEKKNAPSPKEVKQRATRQRKNAELQKKYNEYSQYIQRLVKRNGGRIPASDTKDGKLYHRYVQAMKSIENMSRKKGFAPR